MKQLKVKILRNEKVGQGFYKMQIESPYLARDIKPGQFIEVRCSDNIEPLLRRPLGVHRITKSGIEILYEIVGKGTEILFRKEKGDHLDIIGPLGNGFNTRYTIHDARCTILIAGGIGVAPLLALAEELAKNKNRLCVIIGAKTKSHILCEKEFKKLECDVLISTDDGSRGVKGLATDVLRNFLRTTNDERRTTIYACGPTAMLKTVAHIAKDRQISCQVSLEERMACGVGVCLGCPVKVKTNHEPRLPANALVAGTTNHEYKMVCKDGPVFNAEEIMW